MHVHHYHGFITQWVFPWDNDCFITLNTIEINQNDNDTGKDKDKDKDKDKLTYSTVILITLVKFIYNHNRISFLFHCDWQFKMGVKVVVLVVMDAAAGVVMLKYVHRP